jgi:peptidoglycan/xylan/chitin deacetylase (PgdA/CDA1 family)
VAVVALVAGFLAVLVTAGPAQAAGPVTVSLTFDDGNVDQKTAAALLKARGQVGTFYVNSGTIDDAGFMTKADLLALQADGHEIGGHTVTHPDLGTLPAAEVKREVCQDRSTLKGWGLTVRSFAYPFASMTATAKQTVKDCGYNSARNLGDIASRFGCAGCPAAETIPPADAFELRALDQYDDQWTLDDLKAGVTNAENATGGWVQYTFHRVCASGCGELAISPAVLEQFLDWLKARGTATRTVGEVVGGADKPAVDGGTSTPDPDSSGLTNPGFETLAEGGKPVCWQTNGWGSNTAAFDLVSPGRNSARAARIKMTAFTDGDAKWTPALDLGTCAPEAVKGAQYTIRGWYKSTVPTQYEVYLRNSAGSWSYWTSSTSFPASSGWSTASFTTPAIPDDTTGISFGLNIGAVGEITVDDFSISPTKPISTATTTPAVPDGANGWYRTAPKVSLAVNPSSATREYAIDNGAWRTYNAPVTIAEGTSTFSHRGRVFFTAGDTTTRAFKVDTVKPTAAATFDAATRKVTLTAQDGTSGVATREYKVDAGAWTAYTAPVQLDGAAHSVTVRATDTAGNVSSEATVTAPKAAVVTSATVAPAAPDGAAGWYDSRPTVTLSVESGAPGTVVEYRLGDGAWTAYSAPIQVPDGTTSLQYRGRDASETEAAHTLALKVDTVKPTLTPAWDDDARKASVTATDATSGVKTLEYRIGDGAWTTYTEPFAVGTKATSVSFRATDGAGNVTTETVPVAKIALLSKASLDPKDPDGQEGWYVTAPELVLEQVRGGDDAHLEYSTDGQTWTRYSDPVTLPEGRTTVDYRSVDDSETEATRSLEVKVDTKAPKVETTWDAKTRTVTVKATDDGSGVKSVEHRTGSGAWQPYTGPIAVGADASAVQVRATDAAGNVSPVSTVTAPVRVDAATITLKVRDSSIRVGTKLSGTVAVSSQRGRASGTVELQLDGRRAARVTLRNGSASFSLATEAVSVGSHRLTAKYLGDAVTAPGSRSTTVRVDKARPRVDLSAPSSVSDGRRFTTRVKVSVPGTSLRPTGVVEIRLGGRKVATLRLADRDRGRVSVRLTAPRREGRYTLSASYRGSRTVTSGSDWVRLRVR